MIENENTKRKRRIKGTTGGDKGERDDKEETARELQRWTGKGDDMVKDGGDKERAREGDKGIKQRDRWGESTRDREEE
jgi:hypothetical protein